MGRPGHGKSNPIRDRKLAEACLPFVDDAIRLRTPIAVLVSLQKICHIANELNVLGVWNLPAYFAYSGRYRLNEDVFLHPDVPRNHWANYVTHLKDEGRSGLSILARGTSRPFTLAEAEREAKRRKLYNWIFPLLHSYGFRDGLYCPFRTWALIYVSDKLVVLTPSQRALLGCVAHTAVSCIEEMVNKRHRGRRRHDKHGLTDRELEVLQQRALVGSTAEVAKALNIAEKTVDTHLSSARKKLKIDDTAIALLEAYKHGYIE